MRDLNNNILISDFQDTYKNKFTNVKPTFTAIKLTPSQKNNVAIDSVFISNLNATNFTLNILVKNIGEEKNNIPIAIYDDKKLVSKQSFSIVKNEEKIIQFTIKNQLTFLPNHC